MKKIFFVLLLCSLFHFSASAQDDVSTYAAQLNTGSLFTGRTTDVVPIESSDQAFLSLGVADVDRVISLVYDTSYRIIYEMEAIRPATGAFKSVLGGVGKGVLFTYYFSNNRNTNFASITFDHRLRTSRVQLYDLPLEKQTYLACFATEEKFYVLTIANHSSRLHLYPLEEYGLGQAQTFSFDEVTFERPQLNLYHKLVLNENKQRLSVNPLVKITDEVYNSFPLTQSLYKLYYEDRKIIITLDDVSHHTYVLMLDPATGDKKFFTTTQPLKDHPAGKFPRTNSFLYGQKIFQFAATTQEGALTIRDLYSQELVQEYKFTRTESSIPFANTPLYRETPTQTSSAQTKEPSIKQLLSRMYNSRVALAVNADSSDRLVISIGSYQKVNTTGGGYMGGYTPGGTLNSPYGPVSLPGYFSSMYSWQQGTSNYKTTYFEGLLNDQTLAHETGELSTPVLKKIDKYAKKLKNASAETVFNWNNKYYYGYYEPTSKQYHLVKF